MFLVVRGKERRTTIADDRDRIRNGKLVIILTLTTSTVHDLRVSRNSGFRFPCLNASVILSNLSSPIFSTMNQSRISNAFNYRTATLNYLLTRVSSICLLGTDDDGLHNDLRSDSRG